MLCLPGCGGGGGGGVRVVGKGGVMIFPGGV